MRLMAFNSLKDENIGTGAINLITLPTHTHTVGGTQASSIINS